jgi:hypothetical protein
MFNRPKEMLPDQSARAMCVHRLLCERVAAVVDLRSVARVGSFDNAVPQRCRQHVSQASVVGRARLELARASTVDVSRQAIGSSQTLMSSPLI